MNYLLYLNSTYSYASPTLSQISIWKCVNTEESFRLYCYCREYHTQLYLAFLFIYFTARVVGGGGRATMIFPNQFSTQVEIFRGGQILLLLQILQPDYKTSRDFILTLQFSTQLEIFRGGHRLPKK